MLRSIVILLFLFSCKKQVELQDLTPRPDIDFPSCEDDLLFCDDEEFDDLPEHDEPKDTGE